MGYMYGVGLHPTPYMFLLIMYGSSAVYSTLHPTSEYPLQESLVVEAPTDEGVLDDLGYENDDDPMDDEDEEVTIGMRMVKVEQFSDNEELQAPHTNS